MQTVECSSLFPQQQLQLDILRGFLVDRGWLTQEVFNSDHMKNIKECFAKPFLQKRFFLLLNGHMEFELLMSSDTDGLLRVVVEEEFGLQSIADLNNSLAKTTI